MLGPLAGAATAGKILGLAEEQLAGALGLAASIQLGGAQYVLSGGHEKDLSSGHEARRGLLAALVAEKEILGSHDILEGERGIFKAIGTAPGVAGELGRRWRITECYIKPYPACRYLHASIEAALNLVREREFNVGDIERVVVNTNSSSARRVSYEIKSHVNAIFSHAYQVAAVLRDRRVDLPTAWEEKVRDPLFTGLMRKVEVRATPEYDQLYRQRSLKQPPWPAEVEVLMRDGKRYRSQVLSPKGDPTTPLTSVEVREKFTSLAGKVLPKGGPAQVIELVDRLETVPNVSELVGLLVAARAH
jgi:2-methylcitrate dehydratase PrpD